VAAVVGAVAAARLLRGGRLALALALQRARTQQPQPLHERLDDERRPKVSMHDSRMAPCSTEHSITGRQRQCQCCARALLNAARYSSYDISVMSRSRSLLRLRLRLRRRPRSGRGLPLRLLRGTRARQHRPRGCVSSSLPPTQAGLQLSHKHMFEDGAAEYAQGTNKLPMAKA